MNEIIFRPIQKEDIEAVFSVAKESWEFIYNGVFKEKYINYNLEKYYSKNFLLNQILEVKSGEQFFCVAINSSKIIGFCNIVQRNKEMELARLYLLPDCIGKGIGKKFLELGEEFVLVKGFKKYFCYVGKYNETGKNFYLRNGFKYVTSKDKDDEENNDYQFYMEKILVP